ncbi:hypothetical protein BLNAU_9674 [Blattamonas nauphoetae]|uniref:Uncharacterized protein n=1 Tax=Blattamonas nauphoetae TaxID=2049346 RepID=A0ABQ9WRE3_9EUKA|nr:hypothetical protein BLNAU_23036 [Blattamonas nauphoetae]KAK2955446.1 hypothetical protein BLNAU_9674 [Blattamonas nauphoetae]
MNKVRVFCVPDVQNACVSTSSFYMWERVGLKSFATSRLTKRTKPTVCWMESRYPDSNNEIRHGFVYVDWSQIICQVQNDVVRLQTRCLCVIQFVSDLRSESTRMWGSRRETPEWIESDNEEEGSCVIHFCKDHSTIDS